MLFADPPAILERQSTSPRNSTPLPGRYDRIIFTSYESLHPAHGTRRRLPPPIHSNGRQYLTLTLTLAL